MKNPLTLWFLLFLSGNILLMTTPATAQQVNSQHIATETMLQFSLKTLQESLHKTVQQNERLSFENDILRDAIWDLQQQSGILNSKKSGLTGQPGSASYLQVSQEIGIEKRRQRTEELISYFQENIQQLRAKNQILDNILEENTLESEKQLMIQKKKMGLKNITRSEKRYNALVRQNKIHLKKVDELKAEKSALERHFKDLGLVTQGL